MKIPSAKVCKLPRGMKRIGEVIDKIRNKMDGMPPRDPEKGARLLQEPGAKVQGGGTQPPGELHMRPDVQRNS